MLLTLSAPSFVFLPFGLTTKTQIIMRLRNGLTSPSPSCKIEGKLPTLKQREDASLKRLNADVLQMNEFAQRKTAGEHGHISRICRKDLLDTDLRTIAKLNDLAVSRTYVLYKANAPPASYASLTSLYVHVTDT